MRNAFVEELVAAARKNKNIALVVGDLGFSVIEPFSEEFPDRFINAGVAEQNMAGMAAGMASEGYHVFIYSIGNFPTFRCAEQIRNDVDYHLLPVTVVAVGGGLAYGSLGYSHHAVQDYSLMRSMPNMLLATPGDPMEVRACMRYLVNNPQPSYLRLGKAGEPSFHSDVPDIEPGRWLPVAPSSAADAELPMLLTAGAGLAIAMRWRETHAEYSGAAVSSMPLWSQASKVRQSEQVESVNRVVTVEDHLIDGGFGSWLLESVVNAGGLAEKIRVRGLRSEVCGAVGSQVLLNSIGFSE
jgi:transketolase